MEMKIQRLNEVIGDNEIFYFLNQNFNPPWKTDTNVHPALLDYEYMNNYSGRKIISPAVTNSLGDDGTIDSVKFNYLCGIAFMMFSEKWARNWAVYKYDYDPGENYNMVEDSKLTRDNKQTHSGTDSNVRTGSEANAHSGTVSDSGTSSSEDEVSAFNSSTYQDDAKNTGSASNTRTFNNTDTLTYNSVTDAGTHGHIIDNDDDERNHLTRAGNIGVTTTQQMLQSDIDLWTWNFFYEVFNDIDKIFTISIY